MASGHVNRTNRPNTWLHRPTCLREENPANSEPSTHGTGVPNTNVRIHARVLEGKRNFRPRVLE
jgi:hypothetical protein